VVLHAGFKFQNVALIIIIAIVINSQPLAGFIKVRVTGQALIIHRSAKNFVTILQA
jgi:hypothetical protein